MIINLLWRYVVFVKSMQKIIDKGVNIVLKRRKKIFAKLFLLGITVGAIVLPIIHLLDFPGGPWGVS